MQLHSTCNLDFQWDMYAFAFVVHLRFSLTVALDSEDAVGQHNPAVSLLFYLRVDIGDQPLTILSLAMSPPVPLRAHRPLPHRCR